MGKAPEGLQCLSEPPGEAARFCVGLKASSLT